MFIDRFMLQVKFIYDKKQISIERQPSFKSQWMFLAIKIHNHFTIIPKMD